ncbi:hypothetical protein CMI38_04415 [Candidatus Pacearchaeota archaeon]|jgi:hypothetical protein|nr:hypothetical protein [Candidatus Pacearchaeota archaeon]|tara:strand:- start:778 stop:1932 length:1155 start_codon:yes stop_codon:yes gene_type:complete
MPKQLAYLYDNTIPIYFDSGIGNEYRRQEKMYERLLKFYKGINNEVQFQFYNHDNKKVNIGQHTIKFNLLDKENRSTKVSQDLTIVDAQKGIAKLSLTESQVRDLTSQFYNYSLQVSDDGETNTKIVYAGTDFDSSGKAEVISGIYPEFVTSTEITSFTTDGKVLKSSTVSADPENNSNQAIHTVQFDLDDFSGTIVIKGTLADTGAYATGNVADWFSITPDGEADESLDFTSFTGQKIYTFKGVYSKIAFDVQYTGATTDRSFGIGPLSVAGFVLGEHTGTTTGNVDVSAGADIFTGGSSFVFVFTDDDGVEQRKVVTVTGDGSTLEDYNHFINGFNLTTNGIPAKYNASKNSSGNIVIQNTINSNDNFKLLLQGLNKIYYRS